MRDLKKELVEKLHDFMRLKAGRLCCLAMDAEVKDLYWAEEDKELLEELSEEELLFSAFMLYKGRKDPFFAVLYAKSCPFCHLFSDCEDCNYGKKKGICDSMDSDFQKARRRVLEAQGVKLAVSILDELDAEDLYEDSGLKDLTEELIRKEYFEENSLLYSEEKQYFRRVRGELLGKEV